MINLNLKIQDWNDDSSTPNFNPSKDDFKVFAFLEGEKVGYVLVYHQGARVYAFEVFVEEEHRRKGIATAMYKHAQVVSEKHLYSHALNSENHEDITPEAKALWKSLGTIID